MKTPKTLRLQKALFGLLALALSAPLWSQTADNIHPAAAMEVRSTTKGFLPPRMTTNHRNTLTTTLTPTEGLLIYNTSTGKLEVYSGNSGWISLGLASVTLDRLFDTNNDTSIRVDKDQDGLANTILFDTSGNQRMIIDDSGNVGIGTGTPNERLYVAGNARITGQLKDSSGNAGTSGQILSATANGTDWITPAKTDAIQDTDGNTKIQLEESTNEDKIRFDTGGTERMIIDNSGNVGIGTSTPGTSALLEMSSTTKAFLPPRMTTAERDAIATKVAGMVVYNTTTKALETYDGTAWNSGGGIKMVNATEFAALSNPKYGDAYLNTSSATFHIRGLSNWFTINVDDSPILFHKGPFDSTALEYRTLTSSVTGKLWLDRNIGATRVATSSTDSQAYGHYFAWADITGSGTYAGTGPGKICPTGYRLPTRIEWCKETNMTDSDCSGHTTTGGFTTASTAYDQLKLVMAGWRSGSGGSGVSASSNVGSAGTYWTATEGNSSRAWGLFYYISTPYMDNHSKPYGFSVRCLKN